MLDLEFQMADINLQIDYTIVLTLYNQIGCPHHWNLKNHLVKTFPIHENREKIRQDDMAICWTLNTIMKTQMSYFHEKCVKDDISETGELPFLFTFERPPHLDKATSVLLDL